MIILDKKSNRFIEEEDLHGMIYQNKISLNAEVSLMDVSSGELLGEGLLRKFVTKVS